MDHNAVARSLDYKERKYLRRAGRGQSVATTFRERFQLMGLLERGLRILPTKDGRAVLSALAELDRETNDQSAQLK